MTRKLIATLLAAILALTSLAGCAALAEADEPVTVVLAQNTDPATLDPHKTGGDQAANVWRNIYETLLTYDAEDNLIPVLATSYEQVSDLEWVFYLKEGVTFSNGEPFNAEAVGWNLDRADSEEYARQSFEYRTYYTAGNWEAIDEYTIKVTLDSVDLLFDRHVADVPMIAPGHGEEVGEEGLSTDPCGTGPYVFVSWEPDQEIVLEKNPNYHEGEPEVDTYIIRTIPEAATRVAEMPPFRTCTGKIVISYMDSNSSERSQVESETILIRVFTSPWFLYSYSHWKIECCFMKFGSIKEIFITGRSKWHRIPIMLPYMY